MATQEALAELPWPRSTPRLSIRPFTVDDVEPTWAYRRLPEVNRWLTSAPDTLGSYRELVQAHDRMSWSLVIEHEGVVIGDLMLRIEDAWAQSEVKQQAVGVQAELGWCLDPAYAGRGLATEAVAELLHICFDDLGLRRVTAGAFAGNVASSRLMDRVGMRREIETKSESLHRSGQWLDGIGYALLADEWRARGR